jgi:hypothetical protein
VAAAKLLVALETFMYENRQGAVEYVRAGNKLKANHPAVKGREHLFEPEKS